MKERTRDPTRRLSASREIIKIHQIRPTRRQDPLLHVAGRWTPGKGDLSV